MKHLTFLLLISLTACAQTQPRPFILGDEVEQDNRYIEMQHELDKLHARFRYVPDIVQHNKIDQWNLLAETGNVKGDCEDFALTICYTMRAKGCKAEIALLSSDSDNKIDHAVCVCNHWVLDNRHYFPMARQELPKYHFIQMSDNGTWRKIK